MRNPFSRENFLTIYSALVTIAFAWVALVGARGPSENASFDQITVHRINIVEPDGTTRMVISDKAEFPGAFYMGKEYSRPDRDATGMLFNDDEGSEDGGLIFGGGKDKSGHTHSFGHLSFDEYQRDQTLVSESDSEEGARSTHFLINDDDRAYSITPEVANAWERVAALPEGPQRRTATKAWLAKYPGGIVHRGYFGRAADRSVSLKLSDGKGRERLVARVAADGTPEILFLDANGRVLRKISPNK